MCLFLLLRGGGKDGDGSAGGVLDCDLEDYCLMYQAAHGATIHRHDYNFGGKKSCSIYEP
jgi:hypothetical protein